MQNQNPEFEPMQFDDDLIDAENTIEELLTDVPKPMANYARAINRMLTDFRKPPELSPGFFGSIVAMKPSFKAQICDKDHSLNQTEIEELLNAGWCIDAVHRISFRQTLIVWVKLEADNAETETGNH